MLYVASNKYGTDRAGGEKGFSEAIEPAAQTLEVAPEKLEVAAEKSEESKLQQEEIIAAPAFFRDLEETVVNGHIAVYRATWKAEKMIEKGIRDLKKKVEVVLENLDGSVIKVSKDVSKEAKIESKIIVKTLKTGIADISNDLQSFKNTILENPIVEFTKFLMLHDDM
ncbi:hypothetical protein HCN44_006289 [Aphidius gifuensis]|uniref:Uncharacterized protein n=1 Tax=Aphidius gifuensis TaxID=684658 RepID=A0A835CRU4_APHGI|nr:hypothetical protein HCN44_006289 [Aphidius gifuensis]